MAAPGACSVSAPPDGYHQNHSGSLWPGAAPTFLQVLDSLSATRRYLATSVGVCAYAILCSQQWLLLGPNKTINVVGVFPVFLLFAPMLAIMGRHSTVLFLAPGSGAPLTYTPSVLGIALHFGIAVAISVGCWRIFRRAEL